MPSLYEEHARTLLGLGPDWLMKKWEDIDLMRKGGKRDESNRLKITGNVVPLLADGKPAWKYADKSTQKSVIFTFGEHDAWTAEWERRTGLCRQDADGHPGQEWMGWSQEGGHRFQTCPRCKGTGKANLEPAPATA